LRDGCVAARYCRNVRSIVFRFADVAAFAGALAETCGSLSVPSGEIVRDGEWVLAIFEIGSRCRATAAAARGVLAAGDAHIAFERRDWERLRGLAAVRQESSRAQPQGPPRNQSVASCNDPLDEQPPSEAPPSTPVESMRVILAAHVLLVDEDAETRQDVGMMLGEIGLTVDAVATAEQAKERLQQASFDALVLDFHTKNSDPLDFVRTLRRDPNRTPLPVLVLSHQATSRDVVEAFACGVDDFLPKPFRAPELGARIFGLLRRAFCARSPASNRQPGQGGGRP